ncbi:MAG TPA: hypothetical protein VFP98_08465, partial [Candidatus Polarisedimenticolia bacterium]|nr:hypothetical protein [Candidatus Polarisedimenticolia bacterium]
MNARVWMAPALLPVVIAAGAPAVEEVETPRAPLELVLARPYEVEEPMPFWVDGKEVEVRRGWILVLRADLELLEPCDAPDHLLFVDGCVAQRINSGYRDGHLVVVTAEADLARALVWFGPRRLPWEAGADFLKS